MAANVTRTFITSTIRSAQVSNKGGEILLRDLEPIVFNGPVTEETAYKIVKKANKGVNAFIITGITEEAEVRSMSVETFLEHSAPVAKKN